MKKIEMKSTKASLESQLIRTADCKLMIKIASKRKVSAHMQNSGVARIASVGGGKGVARMRGPKKVWSLKGNYGAN